MLRLGPKASWRTNSIFALRHMCEGPRPALDGGPFACARWAYWRNQHLNNSTAPDSRGHRSPMCNRSRFWLPLCCAYGRPRREEALCCSRARKQSSPEARVGSAMPSPAVLSRKAPPSPSLARARRLPMQPSRSWSPPIPRPRYGAAPATSPRSRPSPRPLPRLPPIWAAWTRSSTMPASPSARPFWTTRPRSSPKSWTSTSSPSLTATRRPPRL